MTALPIPARAATQPFVVPSTLLLSLVFVRAPALYGEQAPLLIYVASLAPFCFAITALLLTRPSWHVSAVVVLPVSYVALLIVAAFRGSYFGAISQSYALFEAAQFALLAVLGALAFLRDPRTHERARYVRALCWAPVAYLAANVSLYFVGFLPAGKYSADSRLPATMLGLVGIGANRVEFPLAGGLNGIGPTAVVALVICAILVIRKEQRRLALAGVLLSLFVIIAIDSRGALLFALLALALVILTPRARKRGLGWVAILLPVVPVVLVLALTGLVETEVGGKLDRGGTENLSTGTGRTVVWSNIIDVFEKPSPDHVFGYGQNGQITSGASVNYAYLFAREIDPLSRSAHNVLLQTLLDTGWIGLLCLIALTAAVLTCLGRLWEDPSFAALLAAALALLLLGVVQTDPTPVHPDSFAFWLLLIFAAARAHDGPITEKHAHVVWNSPPHDRRTSTHHRGSPSATGLRSAAGSTTAPTAGPCARRDGGRSI